MRATTKIVMLAVVTCISALLVGGEVAAQTVPGTGAVVTTQGRSPNIPPAVFKVDCPLAQARTEITTAIPSPWWQTPQIGKLTKTKVDVIGGEKTLCCGYWAYGTTVWVMQKMPAGTTKCTVLPTGFVCR